MFVWCSPLYPLRREVVRKAHKKSSNNESLSMDDTPGLNMEGGLETFFLGLWYETTMDVSEDPNSESDLKENSHAGETIFHAIYQGDRKTVVRLVKSQAKAKKPFQIIKLACHCTTPAMLDFMLHLSEFPRLVHLRVLQHYAGFGHADMVYLLCQKYIDNVNDGDLYAVLSHYVVKGQMRWKADAPGIVAESCVPSLFPDDLDSHMDHFQAVNTIILNVLDERFQKYIRTGFQIPIE